MKKAAASFCGSQFICGKSQQRSNKSCQTACQAYKELLVIDILQCDPVTALQSFCEIVFDVSYAVCAVHIRCALKVVVEAAVVKVDRSDDSFYVVRDEDFSMNEARSVEIDLYA